MSNFKFDATAIRQLDVALGRQEPLKKKPVPVEKAREIVSACDHVCTLAYILCRKGEKVCEVCDDWEYGKEVES